MGLTQRDQDADQLRAEDEAITVASREQPYSWTAEAGITEAAGGELAGLIATLTGNEDGDEEAARKAIPGDDQG